MSLVLVQFVFDCQAKSIIGWSYDQILFLSTIMEKYAQHDIIYAIMDIEMILVRKLEWNLYVSFCSQFV